MKNSFDGIISTLEPDELKKDIVLWATLTDMVGRTLRLGYRKDLQDNCVYVSMTLSNCMIATILSFVVLTDGFNYLNKELFQYINTNFDKLEKLITVVCAELQVEQEKSKEGIK